MLRLTHKLFSSSSVRVNGNAGGSHGAATNSMYRLLFDKRTNINSIPDTMAKMINLAAFKEEARKANVSAEEERKVLFGIVKKINTPEAWRFLAEDIQKNAAPTSSDNAINSQLGHPDVPSVPSGSLPIPAVFGQRFFSTLNIKGLDDFIRLFRLQENSSVAPLATRILVEGGPSRFIVDAVEATLSSKRRVEHTPSSSFPFLFDFFVHYKVLAGAFSALREVRGDTEAVDSMIRLYTDRVKAGALTMATTSTNESTSKPPKSKMTTSSSNVSDPYQEVAEKLLPMLIAATSDLAPILVRRMLFQLKAEEGKEVKERAKPAAEKEENDKQADDRNDTRKCDPKPRALLISLVKSALGKHGTLLVKHGVCDVYADLLREGVITPAKSNSFSAFIEEIGTYPSVHRPSVLVFTLPEPSWAATTSSNQKNQGASPTPAPSSVSTTSPPPPPLGRALLSLAPTSGYWRALLELGKVRVKMIQSYPYAPALPISADTNAASSATTTSAPDQASVMLVAVDISPPTVASVDNSTTTNNNDDSSSGREVNAGGGEVSRLSSMTIEILHEDEAIVVINKPAGVPTVDHMLNNEVKRKGAKRKENNKKENGGKVVESSRSDGVVDSELTPAALARRTFTSISASDVVSWLVKRYPTITSVRNCGLVQRLDAETSGVLVVAKTAEAHAKLSPKDFNGKVYTAICRDLNRKGRLVDPRNAAGEDDQGCVNNDVGGGASLLNRQVVEEKGNKKKSGDKCVNNKNEERGPSQSVGVVAQSAFKIVRYLPRSIVAVKVRIEHGKKHQIRRHLASAGLPIINDARYGVGSTAMGSRRMMLHCESIAFSHPKTSEELVFRSPLPQDMTNFLGKLTRKNPE